MFNKEKTEPSTPQTHIAPVRVLKLDFRPEKAEEALVEWLSAGWELKGTEAVLIGGQTVFLLAFLTRKPEDAAVWRGMVG